MDEPEAICTRCRTVIRQTEDGFTDWEFDPDADETDADGRSNMICGGCQTREEETEIVEAFMEDLPEDE